MRKYYSGKSVKLDKNILSPYRSDRKLGSMKETRGPKGRRIVGISDNGRYYLTNYGSGSIPVDKERKKALGKLYDTDDPDRYADIAKKFKAKQKAKG